MARCAIPDVGHPTSIDCDRIASRGVSRGSGTTEVAVAPAKMAVSQQRGDLQKGARPCGDSGAQGKGYLRGDVQALAWPPIGNAESRIENGLASADRKTLN
jgi:hypothetical protein